MTIDGSRPRSLHLAVMLIAAAAALSYVVRLVAQHTVAIVQARRLLPRWDLATHLDHGWLDYHLLATGQIDRLLWDVWQQGYWPPVLSIYQVPFYLVLGGHMASGLWSALVAFVLVGLTGCALLWRQWGRGAVLPSALFLALLISSPFLLAYASVAMTEMFGALLQLIVLLAYVHYRCSPGPRAALAFALSLTLLLFTKYNYFLLLAVPLAIHEWLQRTSGQTAARRIDAAWRWARPIVSSRTGALLAIYAAALLLVAATGGVEFRLLGQRISLRTIGNSGHVVLYLLLARVWYLHRRGRIDWVHLYSLDPRVRPLLLWLVLPLTIWLASPYPNHIRDVWNLVVNRPLGEGGADTGLEIYMDALRTTYFYGEWVLASVVAACAAATVRYRHQPTLMQCLILAVPIQLAAIGFHQTRVPRFLLLTVVLICAMASAEVGQWFSRWRFGRLAAGALVPVVLAAGMIAARNIVTEPRFSAVAFEHYTDSHAARAALDSIAAELTAADRLAIVGQSSELSPAMFRRELGPPSGLPCFPFEIGGARGTDLSLATRVLLIEAAGTGAARLDRTSVSEAQHRRVKSEVERGLLVLRRDIPVPDMHVVLRLYGRSASPERAAPCR